MWASLGYYRIHNAKHCHFCSGQDDAAKQRAKCQEPHITSREARDQVLKVAAREFKMTPRDNLMSEPSEIMRAAEEVVRDLPGTEPALRSHEITKLLRGWFVTCSQTHQGIPLFTRDAGRRSGIRVAVFGPDDRDVEVDLYEVLREVGPSRAIIPKSKATKAARMFLRLDPDVDFDVIEADLVYYWDGKSQNHRIPAWIISFDKSMKGAPSPDTRDLMS